MRGIAAAGLAVVLVVDGGVQRFVAPHPHRHRRRRRIPARRQRLYLPELRQRAFRRGGAHQRDRIETDRGLWVASLVAGYQVYAVNPLAVSRSRDRQVTSRAKSDAGDAHVLADLVRTDRHQHRPMAGDSAEVLGVKVLARAHQRLIWDRTRQTNRLRSALREFFPAALDAFEDLDHPDALAVLAKAPTPAAAVRLSVSVLAAALRKGGRQRNVDARAAAIQTVLRAERLDPPAALAAAYGAQGRAAVAVIAEMNGQIERLQAELASGLEAHPDAEIYRSQPGLGPVLGARVLGEFETTRTATRMPEPAATTPAPRR